MNTTVSERYYIDPALLLSILPAAKAVLLFLDYDGTLAPYTIDPKNAVMPEQTRSILEQLALHPRIHMTIVSGRSRQFLDAQLGTLCADLAGEHGLIFRQKGSDSWNVFVDGNALTHLRRYREILEGFTRRVPFSFVEEKEFSLVWHYRATPPDFEREVEACAAELSAALDANLRLSRGCKILEIRPVSGGKGAFVDWYLDVFLRGDIPKLIIAVGDDTTDEEMYPSVTKHGGVSIRVGPGDTRAEFRFERPEDVWQLLSDLPAHV